MKYKSICTICGRQTPESDHITEHGYLRRKLGYIQVQLYDEHYRTLNFCPSCAKKSYTIEDLKTIGNYNQWSY